MTKQVSQDVIWVIKMVKTSVSGKRVERGVLVHWKTEPFESWIPLTWRANIVLQQSRRGSPKCLFLWKIQKERLTMNKKFSYWYVSLGLKSIFPEIWIDQKIIMTTIHKVSMWCIPSPLVLKLGTFISIHTLSCVLARGSKCTWTDMTFLSLI